MAFRRGPIIGRAKIGRRLNTITNTTLASATFNGNGATVDFATGFQFITNADLQVIVTSSAGVETIKTITTHYTVTGAGSPSGGTVTFLTAPATGEKVNIKSNVTIDQQTDYQEGSSFAAATHETALDKLTKIVQQVKEVTDRSLKVPVANQSITTSLTAPTATYVLRLNAGGTAVEWASPTSVALGATTTAFTETLLDDADAATARTTLGLGTMAVQASSSVSISGGTVTGITDLALADGGTGASLVDPNADRILFWDDSAAQVTWLTAGTNLTITGTTLDATAGSSNSFSTLAVSGQSDVVADSATDTLTFVAGTGVTITTDAGTDTITLNSTAAAAQADQETATSTTTFVSPGRQQYHPSAAKAWLAATVSGGTPSIGASYNVASITDNGVGDYTVNNTTAFSAAGSKNTVVNAGGDNTTYYIASSASWTAGPSTTAQRIAVTTSGFSQVDPPRFYVTQFGDQ